MKMECYNEYNGDVIKNEFFDGEIWYYVHDVIHDNGKLIVNGIECLIKDYKVELFDNYIKTSFELTEFETK